MATREGYAQIAWRMLAYPELASTRCFRALNLQNLLYLQAELNELEDAIRRQEKIDQESQSEKQRWNARSWRVLNTGAQAPGGDGEKWRLFCEMRDKLKEYSKFTAQFRCTSESCFQTRHWNIRLGCRT